MNKTYKKMQWRGIKATRARFLSILAIVAVGCAFLSGLLATTPDMQYTADKYYDDTRIFDLDVRGTLGMTDDDAEALRALDEVESVMPACVTDAELQSSDGSFVTRIYGVPLDSHENGLINDFVLVEGRMPENPGECLIASTNGYSTTHNVGETYTLVSDDDDDTYSFTELTAVGIVRSPYYMSVESEPSTVGTGRVELILYVYPECYSMEVYTDIFVTLKGAAEMDSFSEEYQALVDSVADKLEDMGPERSLIRYDDVIVEAQDKLDDARKEYDDAKADADKELADARKELDDGWADLADARKELDDGWAELKDGQSEYDDGYLTWKKSTRDLADKEMLIRGQISDQLAKLNAMQPYMPPAQYQAALAQIEAASVQAEQGFNEARKQLLEAKYDLQDAQSELYSAEQELIDGEAEYVDAKQELTDGEKEYSDGKAEADEELADALVKIEDAQADIDDIEHPEWYISDRSDTVSYTSYKSNSDKIAAIAKVFPIFFFAVAALVALTTMTRMVEEERMQIGTLKALGYSNSAITAYYVGYSIFASLIGSAAGIVIGFKTLPLVISNAYSMMYTLPKVITVFHWNYALIIVPVAVACTTIATLGACLGQMGEKPAQLMLPRAPKAGKRILLERIPFIWKHMSFSRKVTSRNVFRYKKRLFMTVFGIAGCCALLLTGFGVRDSINEIVDKQFNEIYNYNLTLYLSDDGAAREDSTLRDFLSGDSVKNYAEMHYESATVEYGGESGQITMYCPLVTSQLKEQFTLRDRKTHEDIPFDDSSAVLTEKLCETLGIRVGDTVTLKNNDGKSAEIRVTGITENYVSAYGYISSATRMSSPRQKNYHFRQGAERLISQAFSASFLRSASKKSRSFCLSSGRIQVKLPVLVRQ